MPQGCWPRPGLCPPTLLGLQRDPLRDSQLWGDATLDDMRVGHTRILLQTDSGAQVTHMWGALPAEMQEPSGVSLSSRSFPTNCRDRRQETVSVLSPGTPPESLLGSAPLLQAFLRRGVNQRQSGPSGPTWQRAILAVERASSLPRGGQFPAGSGGWSRPQQRRGPPSRASTPRKWREDSPQSLRAHLPGAVRRSPVLLSVCVGSSAALHPTKLIFCKRKQFGPP